MTLYDLAQRFVGMREVVGDGDNPFIRWAHSLCTIGEVPDSVPWCSSWLNALAWMLRLPRSKSAAARSWLQVGVPVELHDAKAGYDVVILKRGGGGQPGPDVINAPGHVGLFAGLDHDNMLILGGNQSDAVNISLYPQDRILGIRRLREGNE